MREDIVRYLEDNKVATRMVFAGNIIRHPSFEGIDYRVSGDLAKTDYVMNATFFIGVYPGIGNEEIEYILSVFKQFFDNNLQER